jgi:arylsulfatase A-like enzyme
VSNLHAYEGGEPGNAEDLPRPIEPWGSTLTVKPLYWTLALLTVAGLVLAGGAAARRSVDRRPNIVFVLTDDLAWNLVQYMPHVEQLRAQGTTFTNYFVTDSLCCPSRASIFTGRYPHDTGIFTNGGDDGGFAAFHARGEENHTFATRLQAHGYRTAMMGKYLNGYTPQKRVGGRPLYIPPGWNEWDVAGNGYPEFDYNLNENGKLVHHGRSYLTDVLARKGSSFVDRSVKKGKPFFLEIATFAPHAPYTPAPRHAEDFPGLKAPRTPAFNEADVSDKPSWLRGHPLLTPEQIGAIDTAYRLRAQAVEAVDDLIAQLEATLERDGVADNTYIVFSSDNGLHMGEHRLLTGKLTAFDTDIRVPLVVAGPQVIHGRNVARVTENIDLCPTFDHLGRADVPPAVEGQNLVPLLRGKHPPNWRDAALVEHHGPDFGPPAGPDEPAPGSGNPLTYEALRLRHIVYVEYTNGEREYYDLDSDPYELTNTYAKLSPDQVDALHAQLDGLENCHSSATCKPLTG